MTAPPRIAVDVVVCAHSDRREGQLATTARTVLRELHSTEALIIVVDRNSALAARVAQRWSDDPRVRVRENASTAGLSGARNTGVAAGDGDVVVFFDDDAIPDDGWRARVVERFSDARLGVLAGAVRPQWAGRHGAPAWFPPELGWVVGCDYAGLPPDGAAVRNPIGACMAIRRTVLETAGPFSDAVGRIGSIPIGGEETELCLRIARTTPAAAILRDTSWGVAHHVPVERQRVSYVLRRCFGEGVTKALWSRLARGPRVLAVERSYLGGAIIPGAVGDLRAALAGDTAGLARLVVLAAGLSAAAGGFVVGRLAPPPRSWSPVVVGTTVAASVVICTLGRSVHLRDAVEAACAQSASDIEIIVVDNDPGSGRVSAALAGVDDPRIRIVSEPLRGLSAARNRGIVASRGEIIAFTDDDAIADPDWLSSVLAVFRADADRAVACVTGRVVPASVDGDAERWFEAAASFDRGDIRLVWQADPALVGGAPGPRGPLHPYAAGEFGSGNSMAFRREAFSRIGGFSRSLGAGTPARGGEDLDVFRRVALSGGGIVYEPSALVRHHHRATLDDLRAQMYGYGTGMAASVTRYASSTPAALGRIVVRLGVAARLLLRADSAKNASKPADFPPQLDRAERLGYLRGPFLYLVGVVTDARLRAAARRSPGSAS